MLPVISNIYGFTFPKLGLKRYPTSPKWDYDPLGELVLRARGKHYLKGLGFHG